MFLKRSCLLMLEPSRQIRIEFVHVLSVVCGCVQMRNTYFACIQRVLSLPIRSQFTKEHWMHSRSLNAYQCVCPKVSRHPCLWLLSDALGLPLTTFGTSLALSISRSEWWPSWVAFLSWSDPSSSGVSHQWLPMALLMAIIRCISLGTFVGIMCCIYNAI